MICAPINFATTLVKTRTITSGDASLVRTEPDETFRKIIAAHNQTIAEEIARGDEWRFPDICKPETNEKWKQVA
jgi:hypothetical protein